MSVTFYYFCHAARRLYANECIAPSDKDRAEDKRQIERIYNDVTTGALRKKRGAADLDLSDSDYDEEARRRAKRNREAKLRRALLADERIEKIGMTSLSLASYTLLLPIY